MSRARIRCVAIDGERDGVSFSARVQAVEARDLSPETMKALLGICGAAAKVLSGMPDQPRPARRLAGSKKRKAAPL